MPIRPSSSLLFQSIGSRPACAGLRLSAMSTLPAIGLSSPAKVKAKVDLPAPFGPIRAVTSPG